MGLLPQSEKNKEFFSSLLSSTMESKQSVVPAGCACASSECGCGPSPAPQKQPRRLPLFKKAPRGKQGYYVLQALIASEQAYQMGDRPSIGSLGSKDSYVHITYEALVLCETRRQLHFILLCETPEIAGSQDGTSAGSSYHLDASAQAKIEMMLEKMEITQVHRHNALEPYEATFPCIKDYGSSCACRNKIKAADLIRNLSVCASRARESGHVELADEISKLQRFLSMNVMRAIVDHDMKRVADLMERERELRGQPRYMQPHAYYARCPNGECEYASGFLLPRPQERYDHRRRRYNTITQCPKCVTDGEPTNWCTLCNTSHTEGRRCNMLDPRDKWTPEERAANDQLVRRGLIQYCPDCGKPHAKDDGCDSVHCDRCSAHFCFSCAEHLDHRYHAGGEDGHITMGPPDRNHPGGHYGCRMNFVRRACDAIPPEDLDDEDKAEWSSYTDTLRTWLVRSVGCRPLMNAAKRVYDDRRLPISEEGKLWLENVLFVHAADAGTLDLSM